MGGVSLFAELRLDKTQQEEVVRNCRNCKRVYSLLNGKAAAADMPYSVMVDPVDTAVTQLNCKSLSGGACIVRAVL